MKALIERIFNRWTKWELYKENVKYVCCEYSLINTDKYYYVYFNIYVKTNKFNGKQKFKKIKIS